MSGIVSNELPPFTSPYLGDLGAITFRISPEATKLLRAAGGLIVEVRERTCVTADESAADHDPDPLVDYLCSHPLAENSATDVIASTLLQCDALEHFGVAMGTKAISIWMWRRWTPEIARRHGPARPAPTLRRWRATHPRWGDEGG